MMKRIPAAAAALALTAACGPRMQPIRPVIENGGSVPSQVDHTVARANAAGNAQRARIAESADNIAAAASACSGSVCAAMARGELAVGMTEAQVMAATGTTPEAWEARGGGSVRTLASRFPDQAPHDAVSEVAMVTMDGGRVRSYTYREPQGLRLVSSTADAGRDAQAAARADALLRQGDDFALRGDFVRALDRYDRADVIRPNDPETTLHIARALDKQLRPIEARLRYLMFLHQMELETIRVQGEAYGHLAAAIAEARERVVVLEHRR
jgi:hypothetical protein